MRITGVSKGKPEALTAIPAKLSTRLKINLMATVDGKTVIRFLEDVMNQEWKKRESELLAPDFFEKIAKDTRLSIQCTKGKYYSKDRTREELVSDLTKVAREPEE